MAGYHKADIKRGEFGHFSKIKEEFLEAEDAYDQDNKVMLLIELSDLIGAKDATKRAFKDGTRNGTKTTTKL